jgi:hypothetical protein
MMGKSTIGLAAALLAASSAWASDCTQTSTGLVPLPDLGAGLYLGQYPGGLYPFGANVPPFGHTQNGLAKSAQIQPRRPSGVPAADGRYVLLSIGMSNTTQEFCGGTTCRPWSFGGQAAAEAAVNHTWLEIVDGAAGGQTAGTWDSPTDTNYDRVRDQRLMPRGLSEAQVQAAWVKVANAGPTVSLPAANADAFVQLGQLGNIARALKTRYPNMQQAYFSSRIYAGYASTSLNPEPYAYEAGFAVKWVIEAQIRQLVQGTIDPIAGDLSLNVAPWLAWGAYLWADGTTPNAFGMIWNCDDFEADGTHPSQSGETKVGAALLNFFVNSPFSRDWFARPDPPIPGDLNGDERVNLADLSILLADFGCTGGGCSGDTDGDGDTDLTDLSRLLGNFGA